MNFIPRIIPVLSLLLLLSSCSTGTDPGTCERVDCRRIVYYMEVTRNLQPIDSIEAELTAWAVFLRRGGVVDRVGGSSGGDEVSSVRFNDIRLPEEEQTYDQSVVYRYDYPPLVNRLSLMPPGDSNVWEIGRTFDDSLRFSFATPVTTAEITTVPDTSTDTVSTESDLLISWPTSSSDPDVRNGVDGLVIFVDSNRSIGSLFLEIERNRRGFATGNSISIPSDSLRSWSRRASDVRILVHLDHYRIRDFRLGPVDWARTVYRESLYRRLHIRAE